MRPGAIGELFWCDGRRDWLLTMLFGLLNGLVLLNAIIHNHQVGYDTLDGHLPYIASLGSLALPDPETSRSFFSPPLPYLLPALAYFLLSPLGASPAGGPLALAVAGKLAQLQNVAFSLVLTIYLLRLCERLRPGDRGLKRGGLAMLAILPVYYKSFAFVRGEPLVACLTVAALDHALPLLGAARPMRREALALGVVLGLLALSRQWGLLVFPALGLAAAGAALRGGRRGLAVLRAMGLSFLVALGMGGWFYVLLAWRYGGLTAFNRAPAAGLALSNQPPEFYLGLGDDMLFRSPLFPSFANQLVPVWYSEVWGDYWGHFVMTDHSRFFAREYSVGAAYLGRVNLAGLVPSALFAAGLALGLACLVQELCRPGADVGAEGLRRRAAGLIALVVICSLAGYLWFLIRYPSPRRGDTIKATYTLHIFPLMAVLTGELLCRLRAWTRVTRAVALVLAVVALHNAPAMVTRYFEPIARYLSELGPGP